MPENWIWIAAAVAALVAAVAARTIAVKRRRAREAEREDIYPMF